MDFVFEFGCLFIVVEFVDWVGMMVELVLEVFQVVIVGCVFLFDEFQCDDENECVFDVVVIEIGFVCVEDVDEFDWLVVILFECE